MFHKKGDKLRQSGDLAGTELGNFVLEHVDDLDLEVD
jgi:hypothetical protein